MSSGGELNRRSFFIGASAAGAGLALGVAIPFGRTPASESISDVACEINCWIVIAPDDRVSVRIAHAEMGQGAMTALAMLVAEELACDWTKIAPVLVSASENLRRNREIGRAHV